MGVVKKENIKARLHDSFRHVHLPSKKAIRMIVAVGLLFVVTTPLAFDYITKINDAIVNTWRSNRTQISSWNVPSSWTGYWYTSGDDSDWQTTETITKHDTTVGKAALIVDVDEASISPSGITTTIKKTDDTVLQNIPGITTDDVILLGNLGSDASFKIVLSTKSGISSITVVPVVLYDSGATYISISPSGSSIPFKCDSHGYLLIHGTSISETSIESLHVDFGDGVTENPFADPSYEKSFAVQMVAPRWWLVSFPYDWQSKLHTVLLSASSPFNARIIAVTAGDVDGDKLSTYIEVINAVNADEQSKTLKPVVDAMDNWYCFESLGRSTSGLADFDAGTGPVIGSILVHFNPASRMDPARIGVYTGSDIFANDENGNDMIFLCNVNHDNTYDERVQLGYSDGAALFSGIGSSLAGLYQLQYTIKGLYTDLCLKVAEAGKKEGGVDMLLVTTGDEDIDNDGICDLVEDGDLNGIQTSSSEQTSVVNRDSDGDHLLDGRDAIDGSEAYNTGGAHHVARAQLDYPAGVWSNRTSPMESFKTTNSGNTRVGHLTYNQTSSPSSQIRYEFSKRSVTPSPSHQATVTLKLAWGTGSTPLVGIALMENSAVRCLVGNKDLDSNLFAWDNTSWSATTIGSVVPGVLTSITFRITDSTTFYIRIGSNEEMGPFKVKDGTSFTGGITHLSITVSGETCTLDIDDIDASWTDNVDENFQQREVGADLGNKREYVLTLLDINLSNTDYIPDSNNPWIPWDGSLITILPLLRIFGQTDGTNALLFTSNNQTSELIDGDVHVCKSSSDILVDHAWNESNVSPLPQRIGDRGDGMILDYNLIPMKRTDGTDNFRASVELRSDGGHPTNWSYNNNKFCFRFDVVYGIFMKENDSSVNLVQVYEYPDEFVLQSALVIHAPEVAYVEVNTTTIAQEYVYAAYLLKYLSLTNSVTNTVAYTVENPSNLIGALGDPFADTDVHWVSYIEFQDIINVTMTSEDYGLTVIGTLTLGAGSLIEANDIRQMTQGCWDFASIVAKYGIFRHLYPQLIVGMDEEITSMTFRGFGAETFHIKSLKEKSGHITSFKVFIKNGDEVIDNIDAKGLKIVFQVIKYIYAVVELALSIWALCVSWSGAVNENNTAIQIVKTVKAVLVWVKIFFKYFTIVLRAWKPNIKLSSWLHESASQGFCTLLSGLADICELIADCFALNESIAAGDELKRNFLICKVILGLLSVAFFGYEIIIAIGFAIAAIAISSITGVSVSAVSAFFVGLASAASSTSATIIGLIITLALIIICAIFSYFEIQDYMNDLREQFLGVSHPEIVGTGSAYIHHQNPWQYGHRVDDDLVITDMTLNLWKHYSFTTTLFKNGQYLMSDEAGVYWDCQRRVLPYYCDVNEPPQPLLSQTDLYYVVTYDGNIGFNFQGGFKELGSFSFSPINLGTPTSSLKVRDDLVLVGYLILITLYQDYSVEVEAINYEYVNRIAGGSVYELGPVFPSTFAGFLGVLDTTADPSTIYPGTFDFNSYTSAKLPYGWTGSYSLEANYEGHNTCMKISSGTSVSANINLCSVDSAIVPNNRYLPGEPCIYERTWAPTQLRSATSLRANGLLPNYATSTPLGQSSGTVEFWLYTTGITKIEMRDGTGNHANEFSTDMEYVDWTNDEWHHCRIDFAREGDWFKYWMYVDDVFKTGCWLSPRYVDLGCLVFIPSVSPCYVDAIGCSWDPDYHIGDNKHPLVPVPLTFDGSQDIALSSATPVDGFQVRVSLDAWFDFDTCQPGGQDVRFFAPDGEAIPYWIETWNQTAKTATIWVKVPAVGTTRLVLKYGCPEALPESNGDAVFEFFDGFDDDDFDLDKWNPSINASLSESNGTLLLSSSGVWSDVVSNGSVFTQVEGGVVEMQWRPNESGSMMMRQVLAQQNSTLTPYPFLFGVTDPDGADGLISFRYRNGEFETLTSLGFTPGPANWIITRLQQTSSNTFSSKVLDRQYGLLGQHEDMTGIATIAPLSISLGIGPGSKAVVYDWVRVRKYAAVEIIASSLPYNYDEEAIVLNEDFTGQGNGAYPTGWSCHDHRSGAYCYFTISGEGIYAMDHQSGENVYGWKPFARAITYGRLSFDFNDAGYTVGSVVSDHYVTLQTAGGTDVLTIDLTTDKDGNFVTLKLNGVGGSTHFAESVRHNVSLEFNGGVAHLYVNDVLEATATYTSQALGRLYLGTSIAMHGLGVWFDDFIVSENLVVFDEDFAGQNYGAYPAGWTYHDNRGSYCYFVISGEGLYAMDHQIGDNVYGWKSFTRAITSGCLSFNFNDGGYTVGSTVSDHYVSLQTAGGSDVLTIDITTDRDGNYVTLKLNGVSINTHYAESVNHNVTLEFNARIGYARLFVDDALEAKVTFTSQSLERLYLGTSIAMHGLGVAFDNFSVFETRGFGIQFDSSPPFDISIGYPASRSILISNTGITVQRIHLTLQGVEYGYVFLSTTDLIIAPGEVETITLTITPFNAFEHQTDVFEVIATTYLGTVSRLCILNPSEDDNSGPSILLVASYRYWLFTPWSDIFIYVNDPSDISAVRCYFSAHGVWQNAHLERHENGYEIWHITGPAGAWYGNGDSWFYVEATDKDEDHAGDTVSTIIAVY